MSVIPVSEDWSEFDPSAYLDEYYADIGYENLSLLRFMAEACKSVPEGGVLLDFGGGPTVYPLISASMRVSEIHLSDYLDANLQELRLWVSDDPRAFDWDPFIRRALEIERDGPCTPDQVRERAELIRARVTQIFRCDASRTPPIERLVDGYDVVMTNFCAESATSDREEWRAFMTNILELLKPGGWLLISALKGANHYSVGERHFPAVEIYEDDLAELLEDAGFLRKGREIRSVPADRPTREYSGLMMAVAQKSDPTDEAED